MRSTAPLLIVLAVVGCSNERGRSVAGSTMVPSSTSPPSSITPGTARSVLSGDEDVHPLVLVHGINGRPRNWERVIDGASGGRSVFREIYAAEIAALPSGSVSRASIWAPGFYEKSAVGAPYLDGRASIGGCPVPRTDPAAGYYPIAYVDVLEECVEGILRATGARKVDMVGCSMGGVVARAYLRWRNGATRVGRYLSLESPSRGVNDLEAIALAFQPDKMPFQRWGEIAELARDYPAWGGESYVHRLNDGWDAWVTGHGVTYGNLYGSGHSSINPGTLSVAVDAAQRFLSGASASAPAPPAPGPGGVPAPLATIPGLGLAPTSGWTTLQQALVFLDWRRLDVARDVGEILSDADGSVRVASASMKAGPEFPSAVFDSRFLGLHMDRGRVEEAIQWCTNTRECVRRFVLQGRVPTARVVAADLRVVGAGGYAPWLLLDYELAGGDGFSVQVVTEDEGHWNLRQVSPLIPDDPAVSAAPTFEGRHRIRLDGEPAGQRVAKVHFYDAHGIAATIGPLRLSVPRAQAGPEVPPRTTLVGWKPGAKAARVTVSANGKLAEHTWRLVRAPAAPLASPGDVTHWSAWSRDPSIALGPLPTGSYDLEVRSRHADNVAGELVEEAAPLTLGVRVDGGGAISVRP